MKRWICLESTHNEEKLRSFYSISLKKNFFYRVILVRVIQLEYRLGQGRVHRKTSVLECQIYINRSET